LLNASLRATRVWIFHAEILPKKCVFSAWKTHKKPVEGVTKFDTTMWEIHRKMWVIYLITVVKNVENTQNNSIISFSTCNKRKLTNKTRNMLPLTTNSNISITRSSAEDISIKSKANSLLQHEVHTNSNRNTFNIRRIISYLCFSCLWKFLYAHDLFRMSD